MKFEDNIINNMKENLLFKDIQDKSFIIKSFEKEVKKQLLDNTKDIQDFLNLLNKVNSVIYKESKEILLKFITYYSYHKKDPYSSFEIAKKSGGMRIIHAPIRSLKNIQTTIAFILSCIYKSSMVVHGFTKNKSVVTNAIHHVNKNYVYNIDLENFFPTIHKARIEKRLQIAPYNLNDKVATMISRLCTIKVIKDDKRFAVLPQGAPTSPIISNMICEQLDRRLLGLAKRFNLKYTRYADDITFSSMHNVYQENSEFLIELKQIINDQKFKINSKKTRLQKRGYRQEVTGLIVNDKVNVDRRYIKQLRAMIYSIEKFGIKKAEESFKISYLKDKGHLTKKAPSIENVLYGKLEYLKMVKGFDNSTYFKLKDRFNKIFFTDKKKKDNEKLTESIKEKPKYNQKTQKPIEDILKKHNPKNLINILSIFTQNNNDLKYTTHSWDMGQLEERWSNFEDFLKSIRIEWKKIDKELKKTSFRLHSKIYSFLFNAKLGEKNKKDYINYWGENKLEFGWSSTELKEWSDKGNSPFNYILEERKRKVINNSAIDRFSDIVAIFKNEIEIRSDRKQIKTIFRDLKKLCLGNDFKLKLDRSLDSVEFYTDVQWFKKAVERIFLMMKEKTSYPEIKIRSERNIDRGYIDILIIQVGSRTSKNPQEIIGKILKGGGDMAVILEDLSSLCEWSIEYSQSNKEDTKSFRVDLLNSDTNEITEKELQDKVEGFTHILRFYK